MSAPAEAGARGASSRRGSHGARVVLLLLVMQAACTYKVELLAASSSPGVPVPAGDDDGAIFVEDGATFAPMAPPEEDTVPSSAPCDVLDSDASTGDRCLFSQNAGCARAIGTECTMGTAVCEEGVLRLGRITRPCGTTTQAAPYCARHTAPCCISIQACADDAGVTEICAPGCTTLKQSPESTTFASCPTPNEPWLGTGPVTGCTGDFVCDSDGVPLGGGQENHFTQNGFIFWCEGGVLQQVNLRYSSW